METNVLALIKGKGNTLTFKLDDTGHTLCSVKTEDAEYKARGNSPSSAVHGLLNEIRKNTPAGLHT